MESSITSERDSSVKQEQDWINDNMLEVLALKIKLRSYKLKKEESTKILKLADSDSSNNMKYLSTAHQLENSKNTGTLSEEVSMHMNSAGLTTNSVEFT